MATDSFRLPRIKVSGVRGIEELPPVLPEALDAIGFVAWRGSKHNVDVKTAARVIAALPEHIAAVVVMVEPYPEEAERFLKASGARAVQLCGYETVDEWIGFPYPILRRVAIDEDEESDLEEWTGTARGIVLEHPSAPIGATERVDAEIARRFAERAPCLLAGGLSTENVLTLAHLVRPHGVDASTSLERPNGRKDPAKVAAFVAAADAALRAIADLRPIKP